jgi:filamentous hemagglutinin family protein
VKRKVLFLAVASLFANKALAQVLPTGFTSPDITVSGNTMTVNQSAQRRIYDFSTYDIGTGASAIYNQPNSTAVAVNRVGAGAGPSTINGMLTANGHVMILNPNGVLFGSNAVVNVGSLTASTGNINDAAFLSSNTAPIALAGATGGSIENHGTITAADAGLVAFVAPSVVNSGTITALGGRIVLAGVQEATLSLNGGLYEIAIDQGINGSSVGNTRFDATRPGVLDTGSAGGTIVLSALDAANVVSGLINLEGVQRASRIEVHGGVVELKGDLDAATVAGSSSTIGVSGAGKLQDAVDIAKNSGATVQVVGGQYSGEVLLNKADMTVSGTNDAALNVAEGTSGFTVAADGVTIEGMKIVGPYGQNYKDVNWDGAPGVTAGVTIQEDKSGATIRNNDIRNLRQGVFMLGSAPDTSISGNTIDNTKGAMLLRSAGVAISGNLTGALGNEWDIVLLNRIADGAYFTSPHVSQAEYGAGVMAMSAANNGMRVLDRRYGSNGLLGSTPQFGNRSHIVVSAGSNFTAADDFNLGNGLGNARQPLGFIGAGIDAVVAGGSVEVLAGTYAENLTIGKALTLKGAGASSTIVDPVSDDAVSIGGNLGSSATLLIDGFTFRDARYGVRVAGDTVLSELGIRNSEFLGNGKNGFALLGDPATGVPGLAKVSLVNDTFVGNGAIDPISLGYGDILINYYNGDVTFQNLHITGDGEFIGIQMRGASPTPNAPQDAGTFVFDNVTIDGSFRRPSGSAGTWNPGGPGDAIHLLEYGSVANLSFKDVLINPTVGHGMFLEGLGSTLDIGNTRFGAPDIVITGSGTNPTISRNVFVGSNNNHLVTIVDAALSTFTGAADGFAIEDRVFHGLDVAGLGLVTWNPGNLYVTPASGSIQRAVDAAVAGNTINVKADSYAEDVIVGERRNLLFNSSTIGSLAINAAAANSGIGGSVTANGAGGFVFNAPVYLLGDTALATTGASIAFNGDIQTAGGAPYALSLNAGGGDVSMVSGGTQANPLGHFNVLADDFSLASTLWVSGYDIDALGNVALSDHTLRSAGAGLTNAINAGGNVSGSTIADSGVQIQSAGNVAANVTSQAAVVVAAANVSGNFSAQSIAVAAQQTVNVAVQAPGPVEIRSGGPANVSGSAPALTIDAPGGSASGSFGQVTNTGGGLIEVNGKPQVNTTLAASADNSRVVPAEVTTAASVEPGGTASRSGTPRRHKPEEALEVLENGEAVEIDLSPGND